jgi:predicted acetyltransferase
MSAHASILSSTGIFEMTSRDTASNDLDVAEKAHLESVLQEALKLAQSPVERQFAQSLLQLTETIPTIPVPCPTLFQRILNAFREFEEKYVGKVSLRLFLELISKFGQRTKE